MGTSTRPVALAQRGMVSSPHYLSSGAGLRVLQDGGSAVDAAVAMNAALGVVYPHMTGVGGDALWLIHDASTGKVHALNGSGRAGSEATREWFSEQGHQQIPIRGPLAAITVPGAVDSWCTAHQWFGRLPLSSVLSPAIDYARDGYPVCQAQADCFSEVLDVLSSYPSSQEALLPGQRAPRFGEVIRFPRLAETLETIAREGRDGFYSGAVAAEMVSSLRRAGGLLNHDDFAAQRSQWQEPLSTNYRGFDCYQHPPNSQGLAHLIMLNILEGFDISGMGADSSDYVHTIVEATKRAFSERDRYVTDPDHSDVPIEQLLSKDYAAELRASIDLETTYQAPATAAVGGDTTCSVAVDGDGNAVSVIQSLYHECGSGFVAGDTGVLLQNRGAFFSLDPEHVNRLEPAKRTFHTLMPGMLLRDGRPSLVYGTMGGEGQPQTSTALVTRIVDHDHDVQQAIDLPRWLYGRTWGEQTQDLRIERRFTDDTRTDLRKRGHPVRTVADTDDIMGHAQAIAIDHTSDVLSGGADPRGEGVALGW